MKIPVRCVAVVSVFLPICCFAEGFTIEQVLSAPFPYGLTSASRAPRVAWVFDNKGERNIWVADAPDFVPRQVTHYKGDEGQWIASVRLSSDGKTIVYARGTELNKEGTSANPLNLPKMPKQQAWAVNVSGDEPRLLGDIGCSEEGCEDLQISPDSKTVVWPAKKHIWIASLDGKKKAEQLEELLGESDTPRWSPDGKRIAFVRRPGTGGPQTDRKLHPPPEPLLQLLPISAAQGQTRAGAEHHGVLTIQPRLHLLDALHVDDPGAVDAEKLLRIEPSFDRVHGFAQQV